MELLCNRSTPYAIKKGEIYPLPTNDIPTREHISRDYQWDGEQYEHFENDKDQEKTMRLEVNGDSTLATNQPQVIICKAQETLVERFPFFKIIKGTELIESMQSDTDRTLNEKYFDNMKSEKWLCSEVKEKQRASTSSSPTEIVRVITKQTLRRPNDICVIEHTPLDRIWFEMFNNNYQTKVEEIRYYQKDGEQFKLYNNLNSHVILEHDPPTGVWKSGTEYLNNFNGKSKTIYKIVKLDEGYYEPVRMYHLNMTRSTEAFRTLLIGSKWTEIYGNHQTTLICVEDKELAGSEFSEKDSLYFTKISQQGTGEDNEYNFHDDFKLLTLKIWECTDDANSESSLYGVMNTFTLRRDDNSLKEIIYYDGVTVIHGMLSNQRLHYEFTEFKYLNVADMSVVKFEGKVVMAQGSEPAQVTSQLEEKSAKDTVPVLNQVVPGQNEVFLTKINNIGITLEIGEILQPDPYAGSILDLHCTSNDSSTIERIKSEGLHHPRISKFNSLHHSVVMTPEEIGELFETSHALQECWVTEGLDIVHSSYYRVVTVLKLKNTDTLRQIYYYDEVNIHEADNELTIEVIQYMFLQVKENEDGSTEEGLIKVKLDHFRTLLPDVQFEERHMHHREKIDYRLDREKVQLSNGEGKGITIQVESQDDTTTIIGNPSEIVTCLKIKDLPVGDNIFNSKICSNIGSEDEEIKYVDVSEFPDLEQVSQDIWRCSGDEDLKFLIVQNKMIIKDTKIRVYHKTQVSVGTLFLPNGEEVLLMSDEKFLLEEKSKDGQYEYNVVRIFGTIKYLLETLPEADTFLRHNIEAPVKILTERTNDHIWSLDSVRLLAFRDLKLAERRIQGVHYSGDIHQQDFHTMILDSGASRMFQLGRFYDKVLNTKDLHAEEPLKCIRFTWGSAFTPKYTPRVAEYVGRHLYTMDKQTFDENFQVIDVAVWLCTNKFDELLRVKTVYKPIQEVPIFAVRYADGIEVEVSRDGKHLIKVNEILYMDVLALNVYRYDGNLQERIVPAIPPVRVSSAESYHERDETMMREIQVEGPSKKSCVAAKGEAYLLASVNTLKALFECLKPFFKIPRLGKSRKPTQPPPGKLQELEVESA
ncbi:uncharacterized protein LOC111046354 [Nilaparvata lugens]|uniref:uncharacterized protein LOC111046354 n=1 Tax=Nilaparvata lugens TaxID=108931 RepID=UPI00193D9497|nr:uncharacterized protein LOC111046354 [Nilaparvata lugens]